MSADSEPWRPEFLYEFSFLLKKGFTILASTTSVCKEWKLIQWSQQIYQKLFNLKIDPLDQHDLFDKSEDQSVFEITRKRHDELKGKDPSYVNVIECEAF